MSHEQRNKWSPYNRLQFAPRSIKHATRHVVGARHTCARAIMPKNSACKMKGRTHKSRLWCIRGSKIDIYKYNVSLMKTFIFLALLDFESLYTTYRITLVTEDYNWMRYSVFQYKIAYRASKIKWIAKTKLVNKKG